MTTANFFLTLLEAAGAPRKPFGVADPDLKDLSKLFRETLIKGELRLVVIWGGRLRLPVPRNAPL